MSEPRLKPGAVEGSAFAVGAAGLLLCAAGPGAGTRGFYASYLAAYLFWLGLSLGCLAVTMLHQLVGGDWGRVTRRLLQAGARTLPLMAVLFLPLLYGLSTLYPWAASAASVPSEGARLYLSRPFFLIRVVVYFASWIALAVWVPRWSSQLETRDDPRLARRLRHLCAGGLVLYALTVFYSAVDWILSLEPGWVSTIYGMIVMAGQGLSALAWVTAVAGAFSRRAPLSKDLTASRLNDLGNLLLTFVMLWAYIAFSQYLVIWSGDLPRETSWVLNRTRPGWDKVALFLIVFHFAVPFVLLLFRRVKRSRAALSVVAGALVAVHALDLFWQVRPASDTGGLSLHWPDVVAPLALGGFWIGAYVFQLRRHPPLSLAVVPRA
jgi:hypothetical protein